MRDSFKNLLKNEYFCAEVFDWNLFYNIFFLHHQNFSNMYELNVKLDWEHDGTPFSQKHNQIIYTLCH